MSGSSRPPGGPAIAFMFCAIAAALVGLYVLSLAPEGARWSALQTRWLGIGAVAALVFGLFGRQLSHPAPWVALALTVSLWPLVAGGSSQGLSPPAWFYLGPLRLHAATVAAPFLLLGLANLPSQRLGWGLVLAVVGLTCAQLQFTNALIMGVASVAVLGDVHGRRRGAAVGMTLVAAVLLITAIWIWPEAPAHPHTDFVLALAMDHGAWLAVIGIAVGLTGLVAGLVVFARTAAPGRRALAVGTASAVAAQSFAHIAGEFGWLPSPGGHLPFVSYGGSALVGWSILLGAVCSRSR